MICFVIINSINKRDKIYQKIVNHKKEIGFPYSFSNLCILVNVKSTSSVHNHLTKLAKDGLIKIYKNTSINIQIL